MELVGLNPRFARRYPHEFSGGQRQRIGIARALAAEPQFVIADEPISALNASIQAQILNLLETLQDQSNKLYSLFISHDLRAVQHLIASGVSASAKSSKLAPACQLYVVSLMPYTRALIAAVPVVSSARTRSRMVLAGDIPSSGNPPSGCRFRTRRPYALSECADIKPVLREFKSGHVAACIASVLRNPISKSSSGKTSVCSSRRVEAKLDLSFPRHLWN